MHMLFPLRDVVSKLLVTVLALLAVSVWGQAPSAPDMSTPAGQVRHTSEKIKQIIEDPALRGAEKASERLALVSSALDERFDWPGISRWVLGRNVRRFNDEQLEEFSGLFSRYVVLYYMARVEEFLATEPGDVKGAVEIVYGESVPRRDGSVIVGVTFKLPNGNDIETAYTLQARGSDAAWKVRNFVVEGVSLVSNWRTELNYIGNREKIMSLMRSKVESLEAANRDAAAAE